MIKRCALFCAVMGVVVSLPLFAQQPSSLTPAQESWQVIMGPTLTYAKEQQKNAQEQAQQQLQQQVAQQQLLQQMLQTLRTQLEEHQFLHAPVSTEPLFHPRPLPQTGNKNPWLKPNPWADSHKNPYQGQQLSPTTKTDRGTTAIQQQPPTIFIQEPTQQQKKEQQPINIFR